MSQINCLRLIDDTNSGLINGSGGSGQALQSLGGGVWYFEIKNASGSDWVLIGTCGD